MEVDEASACVKKEVHVGEDWEEFVEWAEEKNENVAKKEEVDIEDEDEDMDYSGEHSPINVCSPFC